MKVGYRKLGMVLGAVAAFALLPARADAQLVSYSPVFWSFEASAGVVIPTGTWSHSAEAGTAFQLAASYFLNPRLGLRAEGGLDMLGTKGVVDPDLQIWHYTAGIEYHLTDPMGGVMAAFDLGLGGATFDTGVFQVNDHPNTGDTSTGTFNSTVMAVNAGFKVGYNFARHAGSNVPMVTFFVQGDVNVMFADEEDSALYAALNDQRGFGTVIDLPLTLGLRVNLP